jgi:hypothetical protein
MISLKNFGIFVMVACLLFPASSVYGHGFGVDTISQLLQLKMNPKKMQKM